jgi:hypothetical protein
MSGLQPTCRAWLLACVIVAGCNVGEEVNEATSCEDLTGVCPVGAVPVAKKSVAGECGADLKFHPDTNEVALGGVCTAKGDCEIVCLVTKSQCLCGIESLTRDELICRECPSCGNGITESGEQCDLGEQRNGAAASECSATCSLVKCPEQERRCSGSHVQLCADGTWQDELDCAESGEECQLGACGKASSTGGCEACSVANCVSGTCYSTTCCTSAGNCVFQNYFGEGFLPVDTECTCTNLYSGQVVSGAVCVPTE